MKKNLSIMVLIAVAVIIILTGCPQQWDIGSDPDAKGIVTYYSALLPYTEYNGCDTTTLNFDDKTFVSENYDFGYPTAAAEVSGKYTDKSWFLISGYKGTFEYDTTTKLMTLRITQVYMLKDGITTEYKDDYEWHTLTEADKTAGWAKRTYKEIIASYVITQDGFYQISVKSDNGWIWTQNVTAVNEESLKESNILKISETTYSSEYTSDFSAADSTADTVEHYKLFSVYNIDKVFTKGVDSSTFDFNEIWKKDNIITFQLNRTKQLDFSYQGTTEPAEPTTDPSTGTASAGSYGIDYVSVDLTSSVKTSSLNHCGDYLIYSSQLTHSVRSIEQIY